MCIVDYGYHNKYLLICYYTQKSRVAKTFPFLKPTVDLLQGRKFSCVELVYTVIVAQATESRAEGPGSYKSLHDHTTRKFRQVTSGRSALVTKHNYASPAS